MSKSTKWFKVFLFVVALIMFVFIVGCGQVEESKAGQGKQVNEEEAGTGKKIINIRVGAGHEPNQVIWLRAFDEFFLPEVDKRLAETNYKIQWNKAYGGTVSGLGEVITGVEKGMLDMGVPVIPFDPSRAAIHNLDFHVPFALSDATEVAKVFDKLYFEDNTWLLEDIEERFNQKVLGLCITGGYDIFSTVPIETVEDVKGIKIGAAGPNLSWIEGTGAVGVEMSVGDSYIGLQTGVAEATMQPTDSMVSINIYEVADYMISMDLGSFMCGFPVINLDVYNELPEEVQKILTEVGREYTFASAELAQSTYEDATKYLENETDIKIIKFPAEEKRKWCDSLPNVAMKFAEEMDKKGYKATELISDYLTLIEEMTGYELPRRWHEE